MRTVLQLAALSFLAIGSLPAEDSALQFVDLRASGGLTASDGKIAALTLMAGDIGNKDQHVISLDADMGIVIGLRGQVAKVTAKRSDGGGDLDFTLGGGAFLGGLGFFVSKNSHAELLFGYAIGTGTTTGSSPWSDRDSKYTQYLGELGYYYTWNTHVQVGVTAGYSVFKVKYDDPVVGTVSGDLDGFDASVVLGYRF